MIKVKNTYSIGDQFIDHKSTCGEKHSVEAEILVVEFRGREFKLAFFQCPEIGRCVEEID